MNSTMPVGLRSRRHITPFTAHRPATIAEALALRAEPGVSAYMAGGSDLIDWLKCGNALDRLIRLDGVPGLAAISAGSAEVRIGALASHAAFAGCSALPDLASLWRGVANPRVRLTGTIGGNVMAGRGEYDGRPALLALAADAYVATLDGEHRVALDELTHLEVPLLTGFAIADPASRRLFADRSLRPAITVWLGLRMAGPMVRELRLAVAMAHPSPVWTAVSLDQPTATLGKDAGDIADSLVPRLPEPITDGRGSADYRRRMARVLTRRLLIRARAEACT